MMVIIMALPFLGLGCSIFFLSGWLCLSISFCSSSQVLCTMECSQSWGEKGEPEPDLKK